MKDERYLVVGATGPVGLGGEICRLLRSAGKPTRAIVRATSDAMLDPLNRVPGMQGCWSTGKDMSWEPLRIERVCEVKYDHLQGNRFRHAASFLRRRPDKQPRDCTYDQLEVTVPYGLDRVFSTKG